MNQKNLFLIAALALAPMAAQAQNLTAKSSDSIKNFFLEEGSSVEVLVDNVGDPQLDVTHYGSDFSIFYYGCEDNTNCDAVQFYSGYATDGSVRLRTVNDFNAEKRWVNAYITDSGSTRLEMDIYLGDNGMAADDFATMLGIWTRHMREFEDVIDF